MSANTSQPSYVGSASFTPCPECSEGSLTWDPVAGESICVVCE
jgi:hypothetical protein